MEESKKMFEAMQAHMSGAALRDAVISKPLVSGDRQVVVLSEVSVAFGGGAGTGEGNDGGKAAKGSGGGSGGMGKATPVAVLVVEKGKARLEKIGE